MKEKLKVHGTTLVFSVLQLAMSAIFAVAVTASNGGRVVAQMHEWDIRNASAWGLTLLLVLQFAVRLGVWTFRKIHPQGLWRVQEASLFFLVPPTVWLLLPLLPSITLFVLFVVVYQSTVEMVWLMNEAG